MPARPQGCAPGRWGPRIRTLRPPHIRLIVPKARTPGDARSPFGQELAGLTSFDVARLCTEVLIPRPMPAPTGG
jgi:hypothetical protein